LIALIDAVFQAKVSTEADLRALRDAAPEAFAAADKNGDEWLQPREMLTFLRDGKLEARAAFIQVLRNGADTLRARGDAESIEIADQADVVLADIDSWLLVIDLFEK
jgi:hypothetical protein